METSKSKGIGKILWEAVELWKDHLFPLIWLAIAMTTVQTLAIYFLSSVFHVNFSSNEIPSSQVYQGYLFTGLAMAVLIIITAALDTIIWCYFSGKSMQVILKDHLSLTLQKFYRLLSLDLVFLGGIIGIMVGFISLIFLAQNNGFVFVQFMGIMLFIFLFVVLFFLVFVPYRGIMRPKYVMEKLSMKQTIIAGYQVFFKNSRRTSILLMLSYLIVFILTPRTHLAWVNQIPFVALGPFLSIVIWTFYEDLRAKQA